MLAGFAGCLGSAKLGGLEVNLDCLVFYLCKLDVPDQFGVQKITSGCALKTSLTTAKFHHLQLQAIRNVSQPLSLIIIQKELCEHLQFLNFSLVLSWILRGNYRVITQIYCVLSIRVGGKGNLPSRGNITRTL